MYCTRRQFIKTGLMALPMIGFGSRLLAKTTGFPVNSQDLSFLGNNLNLMYRSEWTDVLPQLNVMRKAYKYDRITVHHAGNGVYCETDEKTIINTLAGIQNAHVKRHYGDIGYHFVIDYTGRLWEGRSLDWEGTHVSGENDRNIGVMLLGNFEKQWPSSEQLNSLSSTVSLLKDHYNISSQYVYGHRDLSPSFCPGCNLYPYVQQLRKDQGDPLSDFKIAASSKTTNYRKVQPSRTDQSSLSSDFKMAASSKITNYRRAYSFTRPVNN